MVIVWIMPYRGEVLTQLVNAPNATSVSSRNGTVTYAINGEGQLTATVRNLPFIAYLRMHARD